MPRSIGTENLGQCSRCGLPLKEDGTHLIDGEPLCLRCTLFHSRLMLRSALTALVVGTMLLAIDLGTGLFDGSRLAEMSWRVPLTYVVPFLVATWGALSNSHPRRDGHDR